MTHDEDIISSFALGFLTGFLFTLFVGFGLGRESLFIPSATVRELEELEKETM